MILTKMGAIHFFAACGFLLLGVRGGATGKAKK